MLVMVYVAHDSVLLLILIHTYVHAYRRALTGLPSYILARLVDSSDDSRLDYNKPFKPSQGQRPDLLVSIVLAKPT